MRQLTRPWTVTGWIKGDLPLIGDGLAHQVTVVARPRRPLRLLIDGQHRHAWPWQTRKLAASLLRYANEARVDDVAIWNRTDVVG